MHIQPVIVRTEGAYSKHKNQVFQESLMNLIQVPPCNSLKISFLFFFNFKKWVKKSLQNLYSEKKHLPRVLHVLRLIHSHSKFDFEVLIGAVFGDCHFVPL